MKGPEPTVLLLRDLRSNLILSVIGLESKFVILVLFAFVEGDEDCILVVLHCPVLA